MRIQRWSLRRRLGTAMVVAGVLLVGVVAASGFLLAETRQQQQLVTGNYYEAGQLSSDYFLRVIDAESAVSSYATSRSDEALAALRAAGEPWRPGATAAMLTTLRFDPDTAAKLLAVEQATGRWYTEWARPALAQLRAGQPLTEDQTRQGEALFGQVRSAYTEYLMSLRAHRSAALDRLDDLNDALISAVIVSAVVAIATAAMLWGLLRSWVSIPVAALAEETRIVGRGELDHQVSVEGPPEFVRLGQDVEAMRRRLVSQIAAVEQIGREVAEARSRLEEQAAELQRSNRELEQFAYVASHDLQEPLRKVASFCQLLEKRYAGKLDDRADQYIAFAVDGAKRMQRLINDLLEFSRVGRLISDVTDVDLEECLGMALGNLEVARAESGAQITWDPLPAVRGEAPLLTQVLQNLIGNALKFAAEDRPSRVHIGVRRVDDEWEFWCADNGIGIEPEYADRVFVIFQRLHPKDVYGGTGIGLAMCKKIIEYHGGQIWVDTENGEGTTIRWTLPAIGSGNSGTRTQPEPVEVSVERQDANGLRAELAR